MCLNALMFIHLIDGRSQSDRGMVIRNNRNIVLRKDWLLFMKHPYSCCREICIPFCCFLQNAWHNLHSYDSNRLVHKRLRQVHAFVILCLFVLPENDNVQFHQSQGLARWYYSEFALFYESARDTVLTFCSDSKFPKIIIFTVGYRLPSRQLSS